MDLDVLDINYDPGMSPKAEQPYNSWAVSYLIEEAPKLRLTFLPHQD